MGLDKLLIALKQVKAQVPEVWLVIAGKEPFQNNLEHQIRESGIEE
jgi:glycosyltransferase involved in cell wall biosynthesis